MLNLLLASALSYFMKENIIFTDEKCTVIERIKSDSQSLLVPLGVTTILPDAFRDVRNGLKSIVIKSKDIKELPSSLLENCTSLFYVSLELLKQLDTLPAKCFKGCRLLPKISIPSSVTKIEFECFKDCISLNQVQIESTANLKSIESAAFCNTKLMEFRYNQALENISPRAFSNCSSLIRFSSLHERPILFYDSEQHVLFSDRTRALMVFTPGELHLDNLEITIPREVLEIRAYAFENAKISKINLGKNLRTIQDCAFIGSHIKEIVIPTNIQEIGIKIFAQCKKLVLANISGSFTSITSGMFEDCSSLATLSISDTVSNIEIGAFRGCSSLKNVTCSDLLKAMLQDEGVNLIPSEPIEKTRVKVTIITRYL